MNIVWFRLKALKVCIFHKAFILGSRIGDTLRFIVHLISQSFFLALYVKCLSQLLCDRADKCDLYLDITKTNLNIRSVPKNVSKNFYIYLLLLSFCLGSLYMFGVLYYHIWVLYFPRFATIWVWGCLNAD